LDRTGTKLTLLVVDGRQPKLSVGMTLRDLAKEMIRLGCYSALNLDGGGSSTMVYRDPATHFLKVVNAPSDTKERAVADVLGLTVRAPMPTPY
jgi:exopolysaccharide biosynthesis protein